VHPGGPAHVQDGGAPSPVGHGIVALETLVGRTRRSFLFCWDDDGHPVGYAMTVMRCRDGALWFSTYTKSAKVKHLRVDPRACCLIVDGGIDDAPMRWCSAGGTATVRAPLASEVDLMFEGFGDDRVPEQVLEKVRDRMLSGRRSLIEMTIDAPDRLVVLEGRYAHAD
jgi:hypothetical protein